MVLREACKQCRTWQSQAFHPFLFLLIYQLDNFSKPTLAKVIKLILNETGIDPGLLELEITESMSMDLSQSLPILEELKTLGIQISVDDFGTGYSSLNYLHQLPIDHVKIDKSFVQNLGTNPKNKTIVTTIITMAHNLNLTVTAEGAETIEQVQFLQNNQCDMIQGYYYSKAIPASEFENDFSQLLQKAHSSSLLNKTS